LRSKKLGVVVPDGWERNREIYRKFALFLEASGTSVSCTSPMLSTYVLKSFLGHRKHIQKCGFEGILENFECPLPLKKLRCPLNKNR